MVRRLVPCLALGSLLGACSAAEPPTRRSVLVLAPCRLPKSRAAAQCGVVTVPEDPNGGAGGRTVALRVAVVGGDVEPSPSKEGSTPVFLLAGGPGQAAIQAWPTALPALSEALGDRPVVLFDQRGTGDSGALACRPPKSTMQQHLRVDVDLALLEQCAAHIDVDVRFYTTKEAVADLEAVRAALGYPQIDVVGASYGTRVALEYAHQHPSRVRRMVLDGVAPAQIKLPLHFAADTQTAYGRLLAACAEDTACAAAFPKLPRVLDDVLGPLRGSPKAVSVQHPRTGIIETVTLSHEVVAGAVRGMLYSPELSTLLPLALHRAKDGDLAGLVGPAVVMAEDVEETMSVGLFLSVVCAEDVPFIEPHEVGPATEGTFMGDHMVRSLKEACAHWPSVPRSRAAGLPTSEVPALVLSGFFDPATPERWGELVASGLEESRHIRVPGVGHGTLIRGCVPQIVRDFLEGKGPGELDVSCLDALGPLPFFIDRSGPPA